VLAKLRGHERPVTCVAVWKEHTGGHEHDRIATADSGGHVRMSVRRRSSGEYCGGMEGASEQALVDSCV
jgi:hypothetical protein